MRILSRLAIVALLTGLFTATAAEARTRVYVRIGPPPVVVERQVISPGAGYVWVPGHQVWDGYRYVWVRGSWMVAPRYHRTWVSGRWQHERRGYYWTDGRWR
jgi:hypothetical protein